MANNTNNNGYKYNLYNTYSEVDSESFVYEECQVCGVDMTDTEDIFVDEEDHYVCRGCAEKYGIKAVKCAEY
jgi:predicted SprT family Zn-dependent metalloprotease